MRTLEEREQVLNMHFHEGIGYKSIVRATGIPLDTVKAMCRRYRRSNDIPKCGEAPLLEEPIKIETVRVIKPRNTNTPEARIARLEMEVDLLRNFLILTEGK